MAHEICSKVISKACLKIDWDDALLENLTCTTLHREERIFKEHRKVFAEGDEWLIS